MVPGDQVWNAQGFQPISMVESGPALSQCARILEII